METVLNLDGTETTKPLKAIKDKLGVGNGPLAEVKRFIPPIGQGSHSLGGHCHAVFTRGKEALREGCILAAQRVRGRISLRPELLCLCHYCVVQSPGYVKVTAEPSVDR